MSARDRAISWAIDRLGRDVMMGFRGDLRFDRATRTLMPHGLGIEVYDCSGFITCDILGAGGPDLRGSLNAQLLHDGARPLAPGEPWVPADLVFYGFPIFERDTKGLTIIGDEGLPRVKVPADHNVIHVAMVLAGGHVISADGATWGITTLEQARSSWCRVQLHSSMHFRREPYVAVRRNIWVDAIDRVTV